jgi:hypothetical protein
VSLKIPDIMAKKTEGKRPHTPKPGDEEGYPTHPKEEDIYRAFQKDETIDVTNSQWKRRKETDPDNAIRSTVPVDDEFMGTDLDVPGAELDDEAEEIGSEDEENNYYSLGGDKDLEEQHEETDL